MDALSPDTLATLRKRMEEYDTLPKAWRDMAQEYGWGVVVTFYRAGVKPNAARHMIDMVLRGSHEIRDRRRAFQTIAPAAERINDALFDLGLPGSGGAIAAALRRRGGVIVPMKPTPGMVQASLNALPRRQPMRWVSDLEKHRLRLQDALDAAVEEEMGAAADA